MNGTDLNAAPLGPRIEGYASLFDRVLLGFFSC